MEHFIALFVLDRNAGNHLTACKKKKMCPGPFKNVIYKICLQIMYIQYISMNRIWHLITYKG